MMTPTHQALKQHNRKALHIHVDETTHKRNGEQATRWYWLMSGSDAAYQNIRFSRGQDNAKHLLVDTTRSVLSTDQCASYN